MELGIGLFLINRHYNNNHDSASDKTLLLTNWIKLLIILFGYKLITSNWMLFICRAIIVCTPFNP